MHIGLKNCFFFTWCFWLHNCLMELISGWQMCDDRWWHARSLLSIQENWLSNGHGHQSPLFGSVVPTVANTPTETEKYWRSRLKRVKTLAWICDRQGTSDLWVIRTGQCCVYTLHLLHIRNRCVVPFFVGIGSGEIPLKWMCFPTYLRFDDGWYPLYGSMIGNSWKYVLGSHSKWIIHFGDFWGVFLLTPSVPGTVAILLTWWGEKGS